MFLKVFENGAIRLVISPLPTTGYLAAILLQQHQLRYLSPFPRYYHFTLDVTTCNLEKSLSFNISVKVTDDLS